MANILCSDLKNVILRDKNIDLNSDLTVPSNFFVYVKIFF